MSWIYNEISEWVANGPKLQQPEITRIIAPTPPDSASERSPKTYGSSTTGVFGNGNGRRLLGALTAFLAAGMILPSALGRSALTAPARRHRRAQRQPAGCRGFLSSFPDRPNGFHSGSGAAPGSFLLAAFNGALFCFFTYATYNLTNQATLRNWTTQLTLIEVAWGVTLGALAASAGFLGASRVAVAK